MSHLLTNPPSHDKVITSSPIDPQALELPLSAGAVVVVAVSGGADSVALLHLLRHAPLSLQLIVCHLNHQLRGEESDQDALFVKQLATQWGLPFMLKTLPIADLSKQRKQSIELVARTERYRFLEEVASRQAANQASPRARDGEDHTGSPPSLAIATGHTRSDEVETMLFRLARGTGLAGLCGIPQHRGQIIRPLLSFSREQIEAYCTHHELPFREDSSNQSTAFTRNRIRHTVLPPLQQVHPNVLDNIAHTAEILRQEEAFLSDYAAEQYHNISSQQQLDAKAFQKLPPAIQYRVLTLFLTDLGKSLGGTSMRAALRTATAHGNMTLDPDTDLVCDGTSIFCSHKASSLVQPAFSPRLLKTNGFFENFDGKIYKIEEVNRRFSVFFDENAFPFFDLFLDCGKIEGRIIMRTRMPGDRIKLSHASCTQTFKNLFQQRNISLPLRQSLFVLQDDLGVIALEAFGVSQRVCCSKHTTHYLHIQRSDPSGDPLDRPADGIVSGTGCHLPSLP